MRLLLLTLFELHHALAAVNEGLAVRQLCVEAKRTFGGFARSVHPSRLTQHVQRKAPCRGRDAVQAKEPDEARPTERERKREREKERERERKRERERREEERESV